MDKTKSKDDLRAAGKKRLQEFRQKKQQTGSSNKSSSTAIKALADDKSPSGTSAAPVSPVRQQGNELHQKSDSANLVGTLEVGVEPSRQFESSVDDSPEPGNSELEMSLTRRNSFEPESQDGFEAFIPDEFQTNSKLVISSGFLDQNLGRDYDSRGRGTIDSSSQSVVFGPFIRSEHPSNEISSDINLDTASSNVSDIQTLHKDGDEAPISGNKVPVMSGEAVHQNFITEIETLKRQLQTLGEEKELVSNEVVVKAERQVEDASKVKSLIAEVEWIQEDLSSIKNEKVQQMLEFASSQKGLQDTNQHLASELVACQEQVVATKHRASLLSEDLARSKQDVVEATNQFSIEAKSIKKLVESGEVRIAELIEDLATSKMLFNGLQDEFFLLNDELRRFENELRARDNESLKKGNELEVSIQRVQALEADLASAQKTLQEVQGLVAEKSQLLEAGIVSNEKLETLLLAKQSEFWAHGDQICQMESEILGLVHQLEEFKHHLDNARQKEGGSRADFGVQYKANREHLKLLEDEKAELSDELERSKVLATNLSDERSSLVLAFDADLDQLREEVRQGEEEEMKLGKQLLESRRELEKLSDEHGKVVKEMEFSRDECRTALDHEREEKSKAVHGLMSVRDQLLRLIDEKGQKVVALGNQSLEEHKDQLNTKVGENSSLVTLLEESSGKLQETANCVSQLEAEVEKHRAIFGGLFAEKGSLAVKLLKVREQGELMQQTAQEYELELERVRENLRVLQEDHIKLSSQVLSAADELAEVTTDKITVELELVSYRKQVATLKEQNSKLVKLQEDAQNDLQRVREDSLLSASDLASELDKLRGSFSDVLVEKERLASELQLAIDKSQYLEQEIVQSGKDYNAEFEEQRNHLKDLEGSQSTLSIALSVSQSEVSKLKDEKSLGELELVRSREQVIKLEDANRALSGEFDQHREQSNAVLYEKERLVADRIAELDKFRQQRKDAEEAKTKQTVHLQQLLSDIQGLRRDKVLMGSELQTYKDQYQELGDENWKVASEFNKCKDQLQLLTEEKASAGSMLEECKELARKLKESNVVLMKELEDQRECQQSILEQKVKEIEKLQQQVEELVQSQGQVTQELAARQEHSQVVEVARLEILSKAEGLSQNLNNVFAEEDVLQSELNVTIQHLQEVEEENGHLILKLEGALENWDLEKSQLSRDLEVSSEKKELLRAVNAQVDSEVAELRLRARELDVQRVQLAMEVRALKEFIDSIEKQRAHLVGNVESKDRLLLTLVEEKSQLDSHLRNERAKAAGHDDQIRQLIENLGTAKLTIEELKSETGQLRADLKSSLTKGELLMEEKSKLAEDLLLKEEQLKKAVEETLHLKVFEEQLESKRDQLEDSLVRGDELDIKVNELTKAAANLQAEKEIAMGALLASQEELRQSKNNFVDETARLEDCLRVLEGTAATLGIERDDLVEKLAGVEQSHSHLSARALQDFQEKLSLQDQVAESEIQVAEYSVELGGQKDLVSQSNLLLQSLVQELEDVVFDVFPKVGEEFLSTTYNKLSVDHHNSLVSRLHIETKSVSHELQNALLQVSEMSNQLQEAEGPLMVLQKERDIAVETAEQIQSQLEKAAAERAELETSLQRVQGMESAESIRVNEQAIAIVHLQTERDDLDGRFTSLEQSHTNLAEKALQDSQDKLRLQDKLAALEVQVDECSTELGSHKDMVSQSNLLLESLVQRLEHVIFEAFPRASQELLSLQYKKDNPDYHNSLASSLLIGITEVYHQLQNAHLQLSELNKHLQEAEDQSKLLLEEKSMAVTTAEKIQSQLLKAAREKEELEISVKRLEALVSAENVSVDERAINFTNQASEAEGLVRQIQSLNKQLEDAQVEKEYLHTRLAQAEEKLSLNRENLGNQASEAEGLALQIQSLNKQLQNAHVEKEYLHTTLAQVEEKLLVTREKLSLAVTKGKAVVQQRDLWKKSLSEKSKELEMLVVGHQQDVHDRDTALNNAERTIVDLRESLEQLASLEVQLDSLKKIFSAAEQVFLENEDLVHGLCAVLHNTSLPDGWHSVELAEKILWIIACVNKLLQELEATKDEIQTLMKDVTELTISVRDSEARATAIALQVGSLEHEKEELASRLEDGDSQLQQERVQMTEERAQLTGTIRQLDSDIELLKREKEDVATVLQEQAQGLEAEISRLVTRVTEQEWDLNSQILRYSRLDAAVNTLFSSLGDCYETISPIEIGAISSHASWDQCKYIINLLIKNHNLTVVKPKDILGEASLLNSASEEAGQDGLPQRTDDKISSKEISNSVIGIIGRALTGLEQQAIRLAWEHEERNRLQLELTQIDSRLNAVREKLSEAVSEAKSLGEQRGSLKQALMDKGAELETLEAAHKEELQSKSLLLHDATKMLESSLERMVGLEKDLVSFTISVTSNPDPSQVDKLSEMDRQLSETQQRAHAAESEAEDSRNAAAVLSAQLELSQMRLDSLVEEVNSFTKDNNELLQQLESSGSKYRVELQELIAERSQLKYAISNLEQDLAEQKEEREKFVENYKEVSDKCCELRLQAEEYTSSKEVLLGEIEASQQRIADLKAALDHEAAARMKFESDTESVVARIQNIIGRPIIYRSLDSMTSSPGTAQPSSQFDVLSALLIQTLEVALLEIQELAKQKALLAESQQMITDKSLSEREMLKQLKESIMSKDLELIEMRKRIEYAEASKSVLEELLAQARSKSDAFRNEVAQIEQKGAITREKLGLAIKRGKAVAQQRDLLKQSFFEQESLVTKYKNELEKKESALQKTTRELLTYEEKVHALELSASSCRISASVLERQLQEKDKLTKKMEGVLTKLEFSREFQSRDVTEKLVYLIGAVSNAQNRLIVAGQETDALKKASAQLSSDLTDAHKRAALEQESRSMLGVKLEESLFELEQGRNRIAELETRLREVGGIGQQTEMLSTEVLNLKESLQQKHAEVGSRAEEAAINWISRSEESENYIQLCQGRSSELEQTLQGSVGAQDRIDLLQEKVARLEEAVQEKAAAVKAMDSSRGKAVSKLTLTTNKFRELYQQSAGLVEELERMHKNLQDKDAEITQLKKEAAKISSQTQVSQEMLESKSTFMLHLEKLLETAVLSGFDSAASSPMTQEDQLGGKSNEDRCIEHVHLLRNRLFALTAQLADVEKKDAQLQGLRKELEEIGAERANLKANLQRERIQSDTLKAEIDSMHAPLTEWRANQAEEIEEVKAGKRLLPSSTPTPHVRGARRPSPVDVAIDVDSQMNQPVVELDDKGHGFKSLTSSRFMPRCARVTGELIDRLCVGGGRVLMRQPAARLLVTLYWVAIHVWMVFLISAAHI